MEKELLFSVTKKDLKIEYFSGTGGGGQHRNKHQNCIRIHHSGSKSVVTGQSHKDRLSNIKEALRNLVNCCEFETWHRLKVQETLTGKKLEDQIEEMIRPENLKIEYRDESGNWIETEGE